MLFLKTYILELFLLEDSELCEVIPRSLFSLLGHVVSNTKMVVDNFDSCTRISNFIKNHVIITIAVNFYSADMNSNTNISGVLWKWYLTVRFDKMREIS